MAPNSTFNDSLEPFRRHLARGHLLAAFGLYEKAVGEYDEALRLQPETSSAFHGRAFARKNLGQIKEALEDYSEAIRLEPDNSDYFAARTFVRLALGDIAGALADADDAVRLNSMSPGAFSARAHASSRSRCDSRALADIQEALRLDPECDVVTLRGSIRERANDLDGALSDYLEAIRLSPNKSLLHVHVANIYRRRSELARALSSLDEALRLDPSEVAALAVRAIVRKELGDYRGAISDYSGIIAANDSEAGALNERAWLQATAPDQSARDGPAAVADASRACELTQWSNAGYLDTLAAAYAEAGSFELAVRTQLRALEDTLFEKESGPGARARLKLYRENKPFRDQ